MAPLPTQGRRERERGKKPSSFLLKKFQHRFPLFSPPPLPPPPPTFSVSFVYRYIGSPSFLPLGAFYKPSSLSPLLRLAKCPFIWYFIPLFFLFLPTQPSPLSPSSVMVFFFQKEMKEKLRKIIVSHFPAIFSLGKMRKEKACADKGGVNGREQKKKNTKN